MSPRFEEQTPFESYHCDHRRPWAKVLTHTHLTCCPNTKHQWLNWGHTQMPLEVCQFWGFLVLASYQACGDSLSLLCYQSMKANRSTHAWVTGFRKSEWDAWPLLVPRRWDTALGTFPSAFPFASQWNSCRLWFSVPPMMISLHQVHFSAFSEHRVVNRGPWSFCPRPSEIEDFNVAISAHPAI